MTLDELIDRLHSVRKQVGNKKLSTWNKMVANSIINDLKEGQNEK